MNSLKLIFIILIFFVKTGNVLSIENIFSVNNIELTKKTNISNLELSNKAIKKAFEELKEKIILNEDKKKLSQLQFSKIKDLVSYYQVINKKEEGIETDKIVFNVLFDKDKLNSLFFARDISYSDILEKELFLLPVLEKNGQLFIYNQNFFYEEWNNIFQNKFIEFVLPQEDIEIIQSINFFKNNLLDLDLTKLFKEYKNKNFALVIIEENDTKNRKIYLKSIINGKNIDKRINVEKSNLNDQNYNIKIINEVSKELINLIKSQNLIDIRTPSFLNVELISNKKSNLVEFNNRLEKVDLINDIYVMQFNKDYVLLKLKYFGKLNKMIKQLKDENIELKSIDGKWSLNLIK